MQYTAKEKTLIQKGQSFIKDLKLNTPTWIQFWDGLIPKESCNAFSSYRVLRNITVSSASSLIIYFLDSKDNSESSWFCVTKLDEDKDGVSLRVGKEGQGGIQCYVDWANYNVDACNLAMLFSLCIAISPESIEVRNTEHNNNKLYESLLNIKNFCNDMKNCKSCPLGIKPKVSLSYVCELPLQGRPDEWILKKPDIWRAFH